MGREIYDIINDMAEVLNASQMQKLQEVLVKRLSENTVSDYLQTTNIVKDTIPDEKIEILRDNCNNLRDRAMIDFLLSTGIRAIEKGMPIEQVQKILGHEQIDTTLRYAMVNQNNVKLSHRKYIS